jgi:energy-coupling factor transporter ATP-binding protein EcfA2
MYLYRHFYKPSGNAKTNIMMQDKDNFARQLSLYQNANSDSTTIKKGFVIRVAEFERIMAAMRSKKASDQNQHELLLGRRGSGKSTLLKRIQVEIDEDEKLSKTHIAINTAEEQASIYRLSDLWYEVLQELVKKLDFTTELRPFSSFDNNQAYTRYLYSLIHEALKKYQRRVVLLLDNLDRIVENFGDDSNLLRETLLNYNDIQLIGGSTRMDEHFWRYDKPFYEFFRRHRLEALSFDEINQLLNHWSEAMHLPQLNDYALLHRGKIEAIRIMTDGLPRTLQFFVRILLIDSSLYGFDYIKKVMDDATVLYQERLNNLTAPQRKIVQEMAFLWEACATKQLIDLCRMEGKLISSYMKQLTQYGIVETIETNTKNHLYRLSERFFNMWLVVTQGNPDQKRKAKWLTIFLEAWYDGVEIQELLEKHLENLENKKITYDKALILTKALSQSKFIGIGDRDDLIDLTLELDDIPDDVNSELPNKSNEVRDIAFKYVSQKKYQEAFVAIEEIENENDGEKDLIKAGILSLMNKYEDAIRYYKIGILKYNQDYFTEFILSFIYFNTNKNKREALSIIRKIADKYILMALIIEIWNGIFENIEEIIVIIFKESEYEELDIFLENLLYLEQSHLVLSLFESEVHGQELRERYRLLYYATLLLLNRTENNLLLRIPPEVLPTVQGIVVQVREKQAFYRE